jgi:hypothetical protein
MANPQDGDVLIRNLPEDRYEFVDALTLRYVDGPFGRLLDAVEAARTLGRTAWQQVTDERGRPMGDPVRLPQGV